jgi:hypothetical protein
VTLDYPWSGIVQKIFETGFDWNFPGHAFHVNCQMWTCGNPHNRSIRVMPVGFSFVFQGICVQLSNRSRSNSDSDSDSNAPICFLFVQQGVDLDLDIWSEQSRGCLSSAISQDMSQLEVTIAEK